MNNSKFLITGATGLIGSALVRYLVEHYQNVQIVLPVRNKAKAERLFGASENVSIVECDLLSTDFEFAGDVDYVVHCAAPTDSKFFVEHPIETFNAILQPSQHLLEYATRHSVKGFVYLSSLEVYGTICDDTKPLLEKAQGYIYPLNTRSSYPMGKRMVESMCYAYAFEYGIPVRIARLTQTFGQGVDLQTDNRVFAQFARCAIDGKDIKLMSKGKTKRMYLHTFDAVSAILCLIRNGESGAAYNVANESTYCSILEMAEFVRDNYNQAISVECCPCSDTPYLPETYMRLSTEKIQTLGWSPKYGMKDMFDDLILK